jgi:hypothetical protein
MEAMTSHDNVTDIEQATLNECGCCGQMHVVGWSDEYVATLRKQLENARSEALEEAAKVCDEWGENSPHNSRAKAIRALKGPQ